jgi:hypothetical protein
MSFLNIIGVQHRETVAGISVTDSLTTFVALRRWDTDGLHMVDVKFYTSEDGSGLDMCPYKKAFQKNMTLYDGGFNFNLALRDFCRANSITRLGYSTDDVSIGTPNVELVPVAEQQLGPALAVLRETDPLKDKKEPTNILAYFIGALPKDGDLSKSMDRTEPVLALLYAIVASGEVEARPKRARDIAFIKQSRTATIDIIMRNGLRLSTSKDGAIASIRNGDAGLASQEDV